MPRFLKGLKRYHRVVTTDTLLVIQGPAVPVENVGLHVGIRDYRLNHPFQVSPQLRVDTFEPALNESWFRLPEVFVFGSFVGVGHGYFSLIEGGQYTLDERFVDGVDSHVPFEQVIFNHGR